MGKIIMLLSLFLQPFQMMKYSYSMAHCKTPSYESRSENHNELEKVTTLCLGR